MSNTILTSPDFVRSNTSISDNMNGKVLQAVIVESQEIDLQRIIGHQMLEKLKTLVHDDTIGDTENKAYKDLLDKCQYFLAYASVAKLCVLTTYKIDNAGLVKTSDEMIEVASEDEVFTISDYWQKKADWFTMDIQNYIMRHMNELPEITMTQCHEIHATLSSAASSSLFLGGARGRGWGRYPRYRYKYDHTYPL